MQKRLYWHKHERKGLLYWDTGRFKLGWQPNGPGLVLYDREAKRHYTGLLAPGHGMDLAERIAQNIHLRIGLVACCKKKADHGDVAEEFYLSDLFKKAAAYCRAVYDRWCVLSAKESLLLPISYVHPYDETLNDASAEKKKAWADDVLKRMCEFGIGNEHSTFFFHAGLHYVQPLRTVLEGVAKCEFPMAGMGIGEQLGFYRLKNLLAKNAVAV